MSNSTNQNKSLQPSTQKQSSQTFDKLFLANKMRDLSLSATTDTSDKANQNNAHINKNINTVTNVNTDVNGQSQPRIISKHENNAQILLYVKSLTGAIHNITITSQKTILNLKQEIQQVSGIPTDQIRLIFAGKQLQNQRQICDYGLYNQATVHIVLRLRGDIGQFVSSKENNEKQEKLCNIRASLEQTRENNVMEALRLIQQLNGNADSGFSIHQLDQIYRPYISDLVKYLDQKYKQAKEIDPTTASNNDSQDSDNNYDDLKIKLTEAELLQLIPYNMFQSLKQLLPSANTILLRRCQAIDKHMQFHIDKFSKKTLQLSLNDDIQYRGGKLIYATKDGFHTPKRYKGTVTVHDDQIVHGVSRMEYGIRYGLFLLEK